MKKPKKLVLALGAFALLLMLPCCCGLFFYGLGQNEIGGQTVEMIELIAYGYEPREAARDAFEAIKALAPEDNSLPESLTIVNDQEKAIEHITENYSRNLIIFYCEDTGKVTENNISIIGEISCSKGIYSVIGLRAPAMKETK